MNLFCPVYLEAEVYGKLDGKCGRLMYGTDVVKFNCNARVNFVCQFC